MDDDIIATMKAEEAALLQKLAAVQQFLAAYRDVSGDKPRRPQRVLATRVVRVSDEDRMDKFGPYGQRIVDAVDSILPGCDSNPVPTRQIVGYLDSQNIEIRGANKVNALSALLARSSKMKGWGRAGWTRSAPQDGRHFIQLQLWEHGSHKENGEAEASPDVDGVGAPSADRNEDRNSMFR